jgi:hypothetical protein
LETFPRQRTTPLAVSSPVQLSHGSFEIRDVRNQHDCNDDDQQ